jgi:hypothetical protein
VTITAHDGNNNTPLTVTLTAKDEIDRCFTAPLDQNVALGSNCSFMVPNLILA